MSFGKMNTQISLVETQTVKDADGFSTKTDVILATVRAYRERRHGSERWANLARFSEATELLRFRVIPDTEVTTDMAILLDNHRFEIVSVENVKGRNMYIEVLAKEVTSSG